MFCLIIVITTHIFKNTHCFKSSTLCGSEQEREKKLRSYQNTAPEREEDQMEEVV